MGGSTYSYSSRSIRAEHEGYAKKSMNEIFTQNQVRRIHESMDPKNALLRESRDSENHPNSLPIIIALDVTGSMRNIPHMLIKDGLPTLVSQVIQRGILDPQILFLAIGDHECDRYPLQVGQFESGDVEMDLWLTRTYLEGGGGGNAGESYHLAYYYAANHTVTDSWEKRGNKGLLFTIGDEPCLKTLPDRSIIELMGGGTQYTTQNVDELLKKASEKYEIFHIHVMEGSAGVRSVGAWKALLGQRCIEVNRSEDIPKVIAETILMNGNYQISTDNLVIPSQDVTSSATKTYQSSEEIIL